MKPLLAVFLLALMACNEDTVVVVESDTVWPVSYTHLTLPTKA